MDAVVTWVRMGAPTAGWPFSLRNEIYRRVRWRGRPSAQGRCCESADTNSDWALS